MATQVYSPSQVLRLPSIKWGGFFRPKHLFEPEQQLFARLNLVIDPAANGQLMLPEWGRQGGFCHK